MGNVVIDMSMSLDGYIAAPNDNPEQWAGEDRMRLHNWAFDDPSLLQRVGLRRRGRHGGRGLLWLGSRGDAVESRHAREAGGLSTAKSGSDGTRTRERHRIEIRA